MPGADLASVLPGHHPGDLPQVIEVMNNPGSEKLSQGYCSEFWVDTRLVEIGFGDLQGTESIEGPLPQVGEAVEKLLHLLPLTVGEHRESIEGLELSCLPIGEDDLCTRNPVRLLAMDQMPHDVEGAPSTLSFAGVNPFLWQVAQPRFKD